MSAHTADQFQVMYHVSHSGSIAFSFGGNVQNEPFVNNAVPDRFGRQMRQLPCSSFPVAIFTIFFHALNRICMDVSAPAAQLLMMAEQLSCGPNLV